MQTACNLCGSHEFKDMGKRKNALCALCGSYERTRVMKLFLDKMPIGPDTAVLHFAPERGLYSWLSKKTAHYVTADIDLERYSHIPSIQRVDLCDPAGLDHLGRFDLIIHSHVIEHVPCNYTAVLIRLHRLLRPDGTHMFSVPIYGAAFEEDLGELTPDSANQRFGQFDHLRRFSPRDLDRTLGAIFRIPTHYDLLDFFPAEELERAKIPPEATSGYNGHAVFRLRPEDLLI